ncbi:SAM-dependent methyltransferase [Marinobacter nauticus]
MPSSVTQGQEPDPARRWQQLDAWLKQHETFWRPVPFSEPNPQWLREAAELADWLLGLPEDACDSWRDNPAEFAAQASRFLPDLALWPELVRLPQLTGDHPADQTTLPETRAVDMPGRKRLQAGAFTAAASPFSGPVLDWCCGKGHLARTLAGQGAQPVRGFEWDPALVADGNRLAEHYRDPVIIQQQDVMAADLVWPVGYQGVALHACGDLHRQWLVRGAEARAPRLVLSPCCYQRTRASVHQPLSHFVAHRQDRLVVDAGVLKLAVQETVTAPARERRQAARVRVWRLGFDALQRELRGVDEYLPVPSHPGWLNREGFEAFCRWAADKKGLVLPAPVDWAHWLAEGERLWQQVRRLELLRHVFRRPLELWLVLDYALFLEEQGYTVRLGTFCERALTPRNLLLDAVKPKP